MGAVAPFAILLIHLVLLARHRAHPHPQALHLYYAILPQVANPIIGQFLGSDILSPSVGLVSVKGEG